MRTSRNIATVVAVLTMAVGLALPAGAAEGPKHGSCAELGHAFAAWAQLGHGAVGQGVTIETPDGDLEIPGMSDLARLAPGAAAAAIQAEMVSEVPGVPGTPFCEEA